jgi:hypothetical protein
MPLDGSHLTDTARRGLLRLGRAGFSFGTIAADLGMTHDDISATWHAWATADDVDTRKAAKGEWTSAQIATLLERGQAGDQATAIGRDIGRSKRAVYEAWQRYAGPEEIAARDAACAERLTARECAAPRDYQDRPKSAMRPLGRLPEGDPFAGSSFTDTPAPSMIVARPRCRRAP